MNPDPQCPPIILVVIIAIFAIVVILDDIKIQKRK